MALDREQTMTVVDVIGGTTWRKADRCEKSYRIIIDRAEAVDRRDHMLQAVAWANPLVQWQVVDFWDGADLLAKGSAVTLDEARIQATTILHSIAQDIRGQ